MMLRAFFTPLFCQRCFRRRLQRRHEFVSRQQVTMPRCHSRYYADYARGAIADAPAEIFDAYAGFRRRRQLRLICQRATSYPPCFDATLDAITLRQMPPDCFAMLISAPAIAIDAAAVTSLMLMMPLLPAPCFIYFAMPLRFSDYFEMPSAFDIEPDAFEMRHLRHLRFRFFFFR